ncbi:hypothetical protein IWZ01DRAFT_126595 [Phyllosticta capitalensis]
MEMMPWRCADVGACQAMDGQHHGHMLSTVEAARLAQNEADAANWLRSRCGDRGLHMRVEVFRTNCIFVLVNDSTWLHCLGYNFPTPCHRSSCSLNLRASIPPLSQSIVALHEPPAAVSGCICPLSSRVLRSRFCHIISIFSSLRAADQPLADGACLCLDNEALCSRHEAPSLRPSIPGGPLDHLQSLQSLTATSLPPIR